MEKIHVEVTVEIAAPPDAVWDYTQDYAHRTAWDRTIHEARVEAEHPERIVWVRGAGFVCRFRYKLFDRPHRTSLAMVDLRSLLFAGGGGSWSYEPVPGGTRWTQIGTLVFRNRLVAFFLAPLVRWMLERSTRTAMQVAKRTIEAARV
jgi:uncharacterized protein YndB with AHSA1/START domain